MKKIIAIILSLCLLCGAVAFATTEITQTTEGTKGTTTLTYTIEEIVDPTSYVVTIPASIAFNAEGKASDRITIGANPVLPAGTELRIKMTSDYTLTKTDDDAVTLGYAFAYANGTTTTNSPLSICSYAASLLTSGKSVPLNFVLTETAEVPGNYTDTVTFNVSVE